MADRAKIHYGEQVLEIDLPADWTLVANPAVGRALAIGEAEMREALQSPVGTPRLSELARGRRDALILMPDLTRPLVGDLALPMLLEELNRSGIPDERIAIMLARGSHLVPPDVRERFRSRHGPALDRVEFLVHDCDRDLALVGKTARGVPVWINRRVAATGLRIGLGEIMPHVMAGYSGGAKIMLPGVAGRETIIQNHLLVENPRSSYCIADGNPVREEMEEAARLGGLEFIFNLVLEGSGRPVGAVAGDVVAAHRAGVAIADPLFQRTVDRPADVVISTGYPIDANLYQSFKGFNSVVGACKPGATVVHCSPAYDGVTSSTVELYHEALANNQYRHLTERMKAGDRESASVRPYFLPEINIGTATTMFRNITTLGLEAYLVSDGVSAEDATRMGLKFARNVQAAIGIVAARRPRAEVIVAQSSETILRARSALAAAA